MVTIGKYVVVEPLVHKINIKWCVVDDSLDLDAGLSESADCN
jgi:hypothetical protein